MKKLIIASVLLIPILLMTSLFTSLNYALASHTKEGAKWWKIGVNHL